MSSSWWKAWYQNSCWAAGVSTRSPAPGSGGASTSARTAPGVLSDRLRNPTADVIARDPDSVELELVHDSHHAACLRGGGVAVPRRDGVLVGLP